MTVVGGSKMGRTGGLRKGLMEGGKQILYTGKDRRPEIFLFLPSFSNRIILWCVCYRRWCRILAAGVCKAWDVLIQKKWNKIRHFQVSKQYFSQHKKTLLKERVIQYLFSLATPEYTSNASFQWSEGYPPQHKGTVSVNLSSELWFEQNDGFFSDCGLKISGFMTDLCRIRKR